MAVTLKMEFLPYLGEIRQSCEFLLDRHVLSTNGLADIYRDLGFPTAFTLREKSSDVLRMEKPDPILAYKITGTPSKPWHFEDGPEKPKDSFAFQVDDMDKAQMTDQPQEGKDDPEKEG